jgi:hypothetical protein
VFSEQERLIFKYHNGERVVAVDPLKAYRRLLSHPGLDLAADVQAIEMWQKRLEQAKANDEQSDVEKQIQLKGIAAFDRMVGAARAAFGLKDLEIDEDGKESGTTDMEVMANLMEFILWFKDVKKNTLMPPTSANYTVRKS